METTQLINFCRDMFGEDITIHLQTTPGKWYERKYQRANGLILDTVYGIAIENTIEFDFKTGKNEDTILKTFCTQWINKFECRQLVIKDGKFCNQDKKEVIKRLQTSDRVEKFNFYTTLYGIGYFCYFTGQKSFEQTNKILGDYLKSKGIEFKNEFSEAGWVYRFLINKDVKIHNSLLEGLTI